MARAKAAVPRRQRRKKILKLAKGYREMRRTAFRVAATQVRRSLYYAYVHRKQNKRNFRRLWIARINAACRERGVKYSDLIHALNSKGMAVNRKMLASMAVHDPDGFTALLRQVELVN